MIPVTPQHYTQLNKATMRADKKGQTLLHMKVGEHDMKSGTGSFQSDGENGFVLDWFEVGCVIERLQSHRKRWLSRDLRFRLLVPKRDTIASRIARDRDLDRQFLRSGQRLVAAPYISLSLSGNPTIISQGNRYSAPANPNAKEDEGKGSGKAEKITDTNDRERFSQEKIEHTKAEKDVDGDGELSNSCPTLGSFYEFFSLSHLTHPIQWAELRRGHGIDEVLEEKQPAGMKDDVWKTMQKKASSTIRLALAPEIKYSVLKVKTPKDIWDKLTNIYASKSLTHRLFLKIELYSLELEEESNLHDHINSFNQLVCQLANVDDAIKDEEQALLMMSSLPKSYKPFVQTILTGRTTLTFEDVLKALRDNERMTGNDSSSGSDNLLVVDDFGRGRNFQRGSSKGRSKSRMGGVECYYCGDKGHMQVRCPQFCKDLKSLRDSKGRKKVDSGEMNAVDNGGDEFLMTETTMDGILREKKPKWVLDNATSSHICNDRAMYETLNDKGQFGEIKVGSKHMMKIEGVRSVRFKLHDGTVITSLKVKYVPGAARNILSLSVLTSRGYRYVGRKDTCKVYKRDQLVIRERKIPNNLCYLEGEALQGMTFCEGNKGKKKIEKRVHFSDKDEVNVKDHSTDIPFTFDIGPNTIEFGRREFCLVTGFLFEDYSLDHLKGFNSCFRERVFPKNSSVKGLDLNKLLNNHTEFNKLLYDDVVRVCLLLALDFVFMGFELRHVVANELFGLVEDLSAWNDFPWGEYMWIELYKRDFGSLTENLHNHVALMKRITNMEVEFQRHITAIEDFFLKIPRSPNLERVYPSCGYDVKAENKESMCVDSSVKTSCVTDINANNVHNDYMDFDHDPNVLEEPQLSGLNFIVEDHQQVSSKNYEVPLAGAEKIAVYALMKIINFDIPKESPIQPMVIETPVEGCKSGETSKSMIFETQSHTCDSVEEANDAKVQQEAKASKERRGCLSDTTGRSRLGFAVYFFNTFMLGDKMPCCYVDGVTYGVPWFFESVKKVYFPINAEDNHWILAEFHIRFSVITFYDSLPPKNLIVEDQKWWLYARQVYADKLPKLLIQSEVMEKKTLIQVTNLSAIGMQLMSPGKENLPVYQQLRLIAWRAIKDRGSRLEVEEHPRGLEASSRAYIGRLILEGNPNLEGLPRPHQRILDKLKLVDQLPRAFYKPCLCKGNLTNDDTVTHIETDDEYHFKMVFIAFGVVIRSIKYHMRPLIIIDTSHLKGRYEGTNLLAVGMDGNNQIIPIATDVSQGETGPSWTWNLMMNCKLKSIKMRCVFWKMYKAYTIEDFGMAINELRSKRPDVYEKLIEAGVERKVLITNLMEWYRKLMQGWYCERREKYKDGPLDEPSGWAKAKIRKRMQKSLNWVVVGIAVGRVYESYWINRLPSFGEKMVYEIALKGTYQELVYPVGEVSSWQIPTYMPVVKPPHMDNHLERTYPRGSSQQADDYLPQSMSWSFDAVNLDDP
nr:retrovirus-related Pol polyprotein from transposon TNT 1-94 [Tanacetum cinerariifolium]